MLSTFLLLLTFLFGAPHASLSTRPAFKNGRRQTANSTMHDEETCNAVQPHVQHTDSFRSSKQALYKNPKTYKILASTARRLMLLGFPKKIREFREKEAPRSISKARRRTRSRAPRGYRGIRMKREAALPLLRTFAWSVLYNRLRLHQHDTATSEQPLLPRSNNNNNLPHATRATRAPCCLMLLSPSPVK
jgi:hypothetical protein